MEAKKYTQFGTFIVIIMSALLIVFASLLIKHGFSADQETYLYAFLVVTFLICILTFYKLTIIVDNTSVSFKLGIGVFGKSYNLSEIASCKPVKNCWIYGVGIHMIPGGWLYNVSGFKAIELRFKNSTRVIRIGTNKPDEIAGVIKELIGTERESEDNTPEYKIQSKTKSTIIFLVLVGAIAGGFIYYESRPITIDMEENQFKISGEYGFPVNYNDISAIDTVSQMPNIEMRTNGIGTGSVCKGYFRLSELGNATLFINFKVSPFVKLVLKNGRLIYFNLKDRQSTIETFEKIKAKATLNVTK
ncbi:MAG TPA: hypothetical protein VJ602_03715 [Paludibacter sp.]|nr:hypothetical protein [Paludibacter sp.]